MSSKPSQDQAASPPAEAVLEQRVGFLVGAVANKLVNSGSALYRRRFGVGFSEWRIMVMLALEPGVTAKRIGGVVGLDKAAISRSLAAMADSGLIRPTPGTAGRRSRDYVLTEAGWSLHGRMAKVAAEHERRLLATIAPDERPALLGMLQRLLAQIPEVEAFDPGPGA